jgi:carbohydrate-selective porin OprB
MSKSREGSATTGSFLTGIMMASRSASYTAKSAISSGGTRIGLPSLGSENAIELNYSIQVSRCILLQPAFQYYIDVGANPHVPNAAVLGFRTKVTF